MNCLARASAPKARRASGSGPGVKRFSAEDQRALRASAKRVEQDLFRDVPAQDRQAITEMQSRGLTVVELDDATKASFRTIADGLTASWRGTMIPADVYDHALRERNAFRASR